MTIFRSKEEVLQSDGIMRNFYFIIIARYYGYQIKAFLMAIPRSINEVRAV
jgi:hypothetical protein